MRVSFFLGPLFFLLLVGCAFRVLSARQEEQLAKQVVRLLEEEKRGNREALARIEEILRGESRSSAKKVALKAMMRREYPAELIPVLLTILSHPDEEVCELARRLILEKEQAFAILSTIMRRGEGPLLSAAINLAAHTQAPQYTTLLIDLLGHPNASLRAQIARALVGRLSLKDPRLDEVLKSENPLVRISGIEMLEFYGGPHLVSEMISFLADKDNVVRNAALRVINDLGEEATLPRLHAALQEDSPSLQRGVLQACKAFRSKESPPFLVPLLESSHEDLVERIAKTLPLFGYDALPALGRLLEEGSLRAKVHAITIVGSIGGEESLSLLVDLLRDENPTIRYEAGRTIEDLKDEKVGPILMEALDQDLVREERRRILNLLVSVRSPALISREMFTHEKRRKDILLLVREGDRPALMDFLEEISGEEKDRRRLRQVVAFYKAIQSYQRILSLSDPLLHPYFSQYRERENLVVQAQEKKHQAALFRQQYLKTRVPEDLRHAKDLWILGEQLEEEESLLAAKQEIYTQERKELDEGLVKEYRFARHELVVAYSGLPQEALDVGKALLGNLTMDMLIRRDLLRLRESP